MPGEPKRRHSRARKGKRRASISLSVPNAVICPNCQSMLVPHSVCKNCGFYRGKEYIVLSKPEKQTKEANE